MAAASSARVSAGTVGWAATRASWSVALSMSHASCSAGLSANPVLRGPASSQW